MSGKDRHRTVGSKPIAERTSGKRSIQDTYLPAEIGWVRDENVYVLLRLDENVDVLLRLCLASTLRHFSPEAVHL
jgi:hypothetical protein